MVSRLIAVLPSVGLQTTTTYYSYYCYNYYCRKRKLERFVF